MPKHDFGGSSLAEASMGGLQSNYIEYIITFASAVGLSLRAGGKTSASV